MLLASLGVLMAACARIEPRPQPPPTPQPPAEWARWDREARAILSDALEALRTFEIYAAFRVSIATESDRRSANDLAWDPPSSAAWDEATHVARGLHGRAEQLFLQVSAAQLDGSHWRLKRELGEWTSDLLALGEALSAYRARLQVLPSGSDGSASWDLLDRAWARWDTSAAHWGLRRSESIRCAAS
ncbi:MAG: hypothetical protein M3336_06675 [Chloroflexota bacterium]|nr:hypothetical protein [Chloroflexota bacterium]